MAFDRNYLHLSLPLLFLWTIPSLCLSQTEPSPSPIEPTFHDILPKFGLPSGIFPANVKSYSISPDGRFSVVLDGPCYIDFEYLVYFDNRITGRLNYGSITYLEGMQVQRFYVWFDISEIRVDLPPTNSIYFQVGFFNKKLDMNQFRIVRSCRYEEVSGSSCGGHQSWKPIIELPRPAADAVSMLKAK